VEIVNYKVTITEPGGSEHVDLYPSASAADDVARGLAPWPVKVDEQRFAVEIGTVLTVRSPGNSREFTGAVDAINGKAVHITDTGWFPPWHVLAQHDPAEMREHKWGPVIDLSRIRTCMRLGCYAQWMPGKSERLGCKGTSSE
jgi:hypothetical protein